MKKIKGVISLAVVFAVCFMVNTCFAVTTTKVLVSDSKVMVNGETISENSNDDIYLTHEMDNGGTSSEAKEANVTVGNIVNIKNAGTYEFSGSLSDGQIAVNTNNVNGEIVILLNGVNITCKNAPAIFVYNVNTDSSTCNVIIKTAKDSNNYVSGGLIKQSVEGWTDQDKILYSIEKAYNDEGEYFERYKYDGAVSSDISLTFEGEGNLTIESQREGIESKRDITINSGNYVINSMEDGMNAAQDNESVITINGGKILVNNKGTEGDGIDSNGYIYVNGGEIYTFASPTSQDSGLDSDLGIYINGGKLVAIGNMYDEIKEDSKQNSVTFQFNSKITAGTLISLVDEDNKPVMAFETDREYTVITFSMPGLEGKTYTAYEGGTVEGTKVNGLYTDITSYTLGAKLDANVLTGSVKPFGNDRNIKRNDGVNVFLVIAMGMLLAVSIAGAVILIVMKKGNIISVILGVLAGIAISTIVFSFVNKNGPQMPRGEFDNRPPMEDFGNSDRQPR